MSEHLELTPGVVLDLVSISAGAFSMGSANRLYPEGPVHRVAIRRPFRIGRSPVTQAQWRALMDEHPSEFTGDATRPVDSVSWEQAAAFCDRASEVTGRRVRLPSESEWEYACRGGTDSDFFFGPWGPIHDESDVPAEAKRAAVEYAWLDLNSRGTTHPVCRKRANPWGLFDVVGNVWEWCADVWHDSYVGAPSDGSAWSADAEAQPRRCLRGAAWDMDVFRARSPYRSYDHKNHATSRFGFRVVAEP